MAKAKKPAEPPEEIPQETAYESIREFYAKRADEGLTVTVLRQKERGGLEFCVAGAQDTIDEAYIQERFGGGKYTFRLRDPSGKYRAQSTVEIADPPEQPVFAPEPESAGLSEVSLLRDQLARQQEMVLHLIDKQSAPAAGGNDLVKVIEAVAALRSFADPSAQIKSAVSALSEGIKLGMKQNGGGGAGEDKIGSIFRIVDKVSEYLPNLRALGGAAAAPAAPGAGAAAPGGTGDPAALLRGTIQYLKTKVSKDPALWAELILDNLEESHWSLLAGLIEKPYDEIADRLADPDLKREPYRSWFERLIEELKLARTSEGDPDTERQERDGGGSKPNGGAGTRERA